ncbi:MAG: SURF1 family cytochrome oxidase biogenesis protein [Sphingomonadaceae bacterium]
MPTLIVAVALPILLGFGVWQLQRAEWKAGVLADLGRNQALPLADLGAGPIPPDAQFRLVRLRLDCAGGTGQLRAGRNREGQSGYAHLVSCRAGTAPVTRDAGWSARPDPIAIPGGTASFEGRLVKEDGDRWLLVDRNASPPLLPSAPPGLETIPNNHLGYAIQWFSFAAILAVIYGLWLRRWLASNRPAA